MTTLLAVGLTLLASYLIGAIPFGYLLARSRGVDILRQGSGNIGATNVGRVLGKRFGILVFLLDFSKGALPVAVARALARQLDDALAPELLTVAAGLAAFLGHVFPVYLHFRGGKGVATGAGVVAVLLAGPALGAMVVWLAVLCATRYVSLASLLAAATICVLRLWLVPAPFGTDNLGLTLFCFLTAALILARHRANVTRLVRGNENRLKESPAMLFLTRLIHVLALGLWFGAGVFFTFVVALVLFHNFEALGTQPQAERPAWLTHAFQKEDGTQLAGMAIGPIFPWYFAVQGVCALLATATALGWSWSRPRQRLHRVRALILTLALAGVVAGWPLAQKVSDLRGMRYDPNPEVAATARAAFGTWHGYSLSLNLLTLALVTVGMALAAKLPDSGPEPTEETRKLETAAASSATP